MSIGVEVALLSGKTAAVSASLDEDVAALQRRAQQALGVGRGRLLDSSGCVLEPRAPIRHSKVHDGDLLTLLLSSRTQVRGTWHAFAIILGDASVVTWGDARHGGDSSAVQDQLKNVQHIQATSLAFAAIRGDGSVVTWGDALGGGSSSAVQHQLKSVQHIQASHGAFAAILADASVVTWGNALFGGDSSAVQEQLQDVQHIQSSQRFCCYCW